MISKKQVRTMERMKLLLIIKGDKMLGNFKAVLVGGFLLYSNIAMAKLSVAPQFVLFDKNSPKVQMINVVNSSDEEKTFNVKLLHYRQNVDGTYSAIENEDDKNKFVDNLIFYGPRRFTLGAREAQTIKVQRKPKANVEAGEYRSHILFQEAEKEDVAVVSNNPASKGLSFKITALYGVSIPVVVRVGDLFSTASLSNIKLTKKGDSDILNLTINRVGTKSLRGDLSVKYGDVEIGVLKGVNVFLSVDSRNVSIPLNLEKINNESLKGKTLRIEYSLDGKMITHSDFVY